MTSGPFQLKKLLTQTQIQDITLESKSRFLDQSHKEKTVTHSVYYFGEISEEKVAPRG